MFKTGTANQFQHIWALGATASHTVGVWMGNFSGETVIGRTGSSIPARIAADVLRALEQSGGNNEQRGFLQLSADMAALSGNVTGHHICTLSGMAASPACPGITQEWLLREITPAPCTWHRGNTTTYPPEYRTWLAERFRQGQARQAAAQGSNARIRLPVSGSVFYLDPSLPPTAQAIRIETAGFNPDALVYVNDVLQGSINHAGIFTLPLRRGSHRIMVEDENGSALTIIEAR
jgi:penicillin-binding protein 1C